MEIGQSDPFDIITMTPRGTAGLCCFHIAHLMTLRHGVTFCMSRNKSFYLNLKITQQIMYR